MSLRSTCIGLALIALAACASSQWRAPSPELQAPAMVVSGDDPAIRISGLRPGETITVHALRLAMRTATQNGATTQMPFTVHAWARFQAGPTGNVPVSTTAPLSGSYAGADINGLFWSGVADDDAALQGVLPAAKIADSAPQRGEVQLALERDGEVVARQSLNLRAFSDRIAFTTLSINDPTADGRVTEVAGVFAAAKGAVRLPTLILLHGSEGYSAAQAQAWAGRIDRKSVV